MKNFIKIEFEFASTEESEILIAELSEINFYAFVQEDSFGEQKENCLSAFITEEYFNEDELKKIISPKNISYTKSIIPDTNWNEKWESEFEPIRIGNFAAIRASFHKSIADVDHEIIITPKMSFGTGHHATTFLMIELMEKINFKNQTVLDFGTGTGVLAILAEKMGAASVLAIDNDDWSIKNSLENIEANQCKHIHLEKRDNINGLPFVNIILANINFNVLTENAKDFAFLLQTCSLLIISGFLLKDEVAILSLFVKNDFIKKQRAQKDEWMALVLEKL